MVKIIFLGGLGEIGKNLTAIETESEIIVIDCGVSFAKPNVDKISYIVPDMQYLENKRSKVKTLLLTHAHEDHIGNIGMFIEMFSGVKVYGSPFTLEMAKTKLLAPYPNMFPIYPGRKVITDSCEIEAIHVNHSVPQSYAYCINTPEDRIIHSGDLKVNLIQGDEPKTDLEKLRELGKSGVDLLLLESTNALKTGHSRPEAVVSDSFEKLFGKYKDKRIVITMFSSNILRIKNVFDIAEKFNRKVYIYGTTMNKSVEIAKRLGILPENKYPLLDDEGLAFLDYENIVILTSGCQGEPSSGLSKMLDTTNGVTYIGHNDVVIFSSSIIPGNEENIKDIKKSIKNNFAIVEDIENSPVHSSGHGCQSDLKMIINSIKPKNFIPIHGEKAHLEANISLAKECGINQDSIILPQNGRLVNLTNSKIEIGEQIEDKTINLNSARQVVRKIDYAPIKANMGQNGVMLVSLIVDCKRHIIYGKPTIRLVASTFPRKVLPELSNVIFEMSKDKMIELSIDIREFEKEIFDKVNDFLTGFYSHPEIIVQVHNINLNDFIRIDEKYIQGKAESSMLVELFKKK